MNTKYVETNFAKANNTYRTTGIYKINFTCITANNEY